ncbi:MAG: CDP-glycerol glycerophosphotransferase family protein [Bacteroidaceae bacterium]
MSLLNVVTLMRQMIKRRSVKELVMKNVELLYGYPMYAVSFLMPRCRKKWLIGSHIGFAGNSKYFFIDMVSNHRQDVQCIWITASRTEVKHLSELGLPAYYRWSWKGLWHCLTAGSYIFSYQLTDVNFWTSGGVKRVNLWHGVGIKNIEFKTSKGSGKLICDEKNVLARIYLPYQFKRPHCFLSTSPLMTQHFMECFRIDRSSCIEFLYPRCELFFWGRERLKKFVDKYETASSRQLIRRLEQSRKSYLYMPTWRSKRSNFVEEVHFDFAALNQILVEKNDLFLLKLHPEEAFSLESVRDYSNIIVLDKRIDIYPILPFTSVLVTDYSSIYYDYIMMRDKDVLLFPFDYKEYITADRDLAFDFDEYTPGKRVHTFEELLQYVKDDVPLAFSHRDWIVRQFWGEPIREEASEDIYRYLTNKDE